MGGKQTTPEKSDIETKPNETRLYGNQVRQDDDISQSTFDTPSTNRSRKMPRKGNKRLQELRRIGLEHQEKLKSSNRKNEGGQSWYFGDDDNDDLGSFQDITDHHDEVLYKEDRSNDNYDSIKDDEERIIGDDYSNDYQPSPTPSKHYYSHRRNKSSHDFRDSHENVDGYSYEENVETNSAYIENESILTSDDEEYRKFARPDDYNQVLHKYGLHKNETSLPLKRDQIHKEENVLLEKQLNNGLKEYKITKPDYKNAKVSLPKHYYRSTKISLDREADSRGKLPGNNIIANNHSNTIMKQIVDNDNGKMIRERKALKNKAIRQREKDMKLLWGEETNTKLLIRKAVNKQVDTSEEPQDTSTNEINGIANEHQSLEERDFQERVPTGFVKKKRSKDAGWGFSKKISPSDERKNSYRSVSADQIYTSKKNYQKTDFPSSPRNQFEIRKEFDKERKRIDKGRYEQRSVTPISPSESMDNKRKYTSKNIITPLDW